VSACTFVAQPSRRSTSDFSGLHPLRVGGDFRLRVDLRDQFAGHIPDGMLHAVREIDLLADRGVRLHGGDESGRGIPDKVQVAGGRRAAEADFRLPLRSWADDGRSKRLAATASARRR